MTYSLDTDYRRVAVTLRPTDKRGCSHVPLARAVVRYNPSKQLHANNGRIITAHFASDGNNVTVDFTVEYDEMNDQEFIGKVASEAQAWLSGEMTRLTELRDSLEALKEAFPLSNGND